MHYFGICKAVHTSGSILYVTVTYAPVASDMFFVHTHHLYIAVHISLQSLVLYVYEADFIVLFLFGSI